MNVLIVGNLRIFIDEKKNKVSIYKNDLYPLMDFIEIPPSAKLFGGSPEEFEDFLGRIQKKYGHLYNK
jgi:hypothetical protein